jgi:hypothetical protein
MLTGSLEFFLFLHDGTYHELLCIDLTMKNNAAAAVSHADAYGHKPGNAAAAMHARNGA